MMFFGGSFNDEQLGVLQSAFDRACGELGISPADNDGRTRAAQAILALSKAGQLDVQQLTKNAVYRCRYLEH